MSPRKMSRAPVIVVGVVVLVVAALGGALWLARSGFFERVAEEREQVQIEEAASALVRPALERVDDDPTRVAAFAEQLAVLGRAQGGDEWAEAAEESVSATESAESAASAGAVGVLAPDGDAITSVQVAGIDEGDIVKAFGTRLAVLRRGRVFVLAQTAPQSVEPTEGESAEPPPLALEAPTPLAPEAPTPLALEHYRDLPSEGMQFWDEMLVHRRGDAHELVLLGLGQRGTSVVRVDASAAGDSPPLERFTVPSYDYYSSRDYATRLIGDHLLLYVGQPLDRADDGAYRIPELELTSDTHPGASLVEGRELYPPLVPSVDPAVHTLVRCDLSAIPTTCSARSLVGPWARSMFVSATATYLWVGEERWRSGDEPAALVRLPHDGSAPTALRTHGMPLESLSWLEQGERLHVLIATSGQGPGMYGAERVAGRLELFSTDLAALSSAAPEAPASAYRALPTGEEWAGWAPSYAQRWVRGTLLHGFSASETAGSVYVTSPEQQSTLELRVDHTVDRIEAMGAYAVAIGSHERALHWSVISLDGEASVIARHTVESADSQDQRTHAFSYRVMPDGTAVVGLPLRSRATSSEEGAARIHFLRVQDDGSLDPLGDLVASAGEENVGDSCLVSCDDWYGNARPILWRGGLFALLGYELIEGRLQSGRLVEHTRASFLPESLRGPATPHPHWAEK